MNLTDFTVAELTAAINKYPVQWGEIGKRGIFADRGIRTREVVIEDREGALAVLNTHDWGADGTAASAIARKTYAFSIKQTVHEDIVSAADVQGVRAFGQDAGVDGLQSISTETADRLQRMRAKHDITLEYKRMGALKGNVLNADGSTSLANIFTAFGVTQTTVDFVLGTSTTKILDKCAEVRNQIEDNLGGDSMTGIDVAVSPEFFSKLVDHAKVTDAYKYHQEASVRLATDQRKGFTFGGITFWEYRANITGPGRLITAQQGHAYPVGTIDTFATYYAPADFNEAANTIGLPIYVKTAPNKLDRGVVLHTQCNSLPLCHRPAVLVKVITSN